METVKIFSIIKDIVLALSAVAVAFFVWLGLKTWRKELTGKARFRTARNMMRSGFELRANFRWVRHPITTSNEYVDRIVQGEESESEAQILNDWYAKNKRLNSVIESLNKIRELQWEAETLLNESSAQNVKEAVQSYRESYGDLSSAISSYFDARRDEARHKELDKDQEWLRELSKIIYSASNDAFSKKVDDATDKLSSALKQYVK